jgi:hypothetical protein
MAKCVTVDQGIRSSIAFRSAGNTARSGDLALRSGEGFGQYQVSR